MIRKANFLTWTIEREKRARAYALNDCDGREESGGVPKGGSSSESSILPVRVERRARSIVPLWRSEAIHVREKARMREPAKRRSNQAYAGGNRK